MTRPGSQFEPFLRTVRRRLALVRVAEHAGIGALVGCVAAALFLPLLVWRSQPAVVPAGVLLALGAVVGGAWGVVRRPSLLAAAMEADRQLGLADLLGTATTVHAAAGADPWSRTVVALADECCRRNTPSQVLLNQLGARAWGGIGLAAALVMALATLTTTPTGLVADGGARPGVVALNGPREVAGRRPAVRPQNSPAGAPGVTPGRAQQNPAEQTGVAATHPPAPRESESAGSNNSRSRASGPDGQGGGAGKAPSLRPATPEAPPQTSSPARAGTRQGDDFGGSGTASANAPPSTPGDTAGAAASPGPATEERTPPWRTASWPADAKAARDAVDSGRVPDAYRDLVRAYFDRR